MLHIQFERKSCVTNTGGVSRWFNYDTYDMLSHIDWSCLLRNQINSWAYQLDTSKWTQKWSFKAAKYVKGIHIRFYEERLSLVRVEVSNQNHVI